MKLFILFVVGILVLFLHHCLIHGVLFDPNDFLALKSHEALIAIFATGAVVAWWVKK